MDNIIFSYTREDAIADGVFMEVNKMAKEAGIKHPVAITTNLYNKYINPESMPSGQDEKGRLWDVLWMFSCCCRGMLGELDGNRAKFPVGFFNGEEVEEIELRAVIEPTSATDPSPAINIFLPEDD